MLNKLKTRWLGITILADMSLTVLALLLARWLRGYFPAGVYLDETFSFAFLDKPLQFSSAILIPLIICVWFIVFSTLSIYNPKFIFTQYERVQPILVAITGAVLVFAGLAYFLFSELSRFLFLYFYVLDVIFLVGWRKLVAGLARKNVTPSWQPKHNILIVGQGHLAQDVARAIQTFAWSGLKLVGFVGDEADALGGLDEVTTVVKEFSIDEVIFALPPGHQHLLQQMVFQLQPLSVNLRLVPDVIDMVFIRATIEDFAGLPLIGLREPAISIFDRLIKRTFDLVLAMVILITTAPLTLLSICLIKVDSKGPIFYTAQRVGEGGKIFNMIKFRTMVDNADKQETELLVQSNGTIGFNKTPNDPRVTRVGRFLRRTSLDELPQLLNVLKGDMSLVGPRPELPWMVDRYQPWQYQRFTVPQGMTGWWQVKNRANQQCYDVRVEDDLYYIHNYSLLLDLRILWMTMGAIVRGDGAY